MSSVCIYSNRLICLQKEKSQSVVELQKLVIRYEQTAILKKQLLEETKADLAAVCYLQKV